MRELTLQQAEDLLYGACMRGAGGGGSLTEGLELVRAIYERGQFVQLISVEEIEDDWLIVSPYYVGSMAPPSDVVKSKLQHLQVLDGNPSVFATKALEKHLNQQVKAICATELGGNTAWAIDVAATMQLPLVDGDPAGRAVPDLAHTTFNVFNASITPFALANRYGDSLIVESVVDHDRADQIARSFATISGNFSGICDHPLNGEKFKKYIIKGTLSESEQLGKLRRENNCPIDIIAQQENVTLFVKGEVIQSEWKDAMGFIEGIIVVESSADKEKYTIWFRNENMYLKKNDELISIAPEIISILHADTGEPILNPYCEIGMKVAIVNFRAPDIWANEGINIFGPTYFGMRNEQFYEIQKKLYTDK